VTDDDLATLPFHDGLEAPAVGNGATGRKPCRRHEWFREVIAEPDGGRSLSHTAFCLRCHAVRDPAASRRGRTNRSRGNAIERDVARHLGLRRVGQYGGKEDVAGDLWAAQVKSGGAFSERYWAWLKAVPVNADQVQLLVVTDARGPGHPRRAIVVLDLDDWRDLHGAADMLPDDRAAARLG
jgi:hypothetical protein